MIFSDPADVAGEGQNQETDVYPETMFLPDTGIQRGSLLLFDGDPETPNMPSLPEGIYRLSKEEIDQENILPKIPCQPLGYRDAKEFMKVCTRNTSRCLYRFFDSKNVAAYNLAFQVFEGFIGNTNLKQQKISILARAFLENPIFVLFPA